MTDPLSADLASLRIDRSNERQLSHRRTSRVPLFALALVVGAGGVAAAAPRLGGIAKGWFPEEVATTEVISVAPAQADVSLTSSGYVVAQRVSHVGAKVMGKVVSVAVREGDVVKEGSVLALLDQADAQALVRAAQTRVASARARFEMAEANLADITQQTDRERRLVEKGVAPPATFQDMEAKRVSAQRGVDVARADIAGTLAEMAPLAVAVGDHRVLAPISGVVFSKPLAVGEIASPGGRPVAEIFDPESLVVETDVPEARLGLARPSSPCEIVLDAYPSKRLRGEVTEIGHRVDRAKATITVKIKFVDSPIGVLPDMAARTSFLSQALSQADEAAAPKHVLPSAAVVAREGKAVVFAVEGDHVEMVPVRTQPMAGEMSELVEGPSAGTKVVAAPSASLKSGQIIKEKKKS